tara:strand:+ start:1259 stop:1975 length:717 start_codon:yes stop_codon:yes gene_type:complete
MKLPIQETPNYNTVLPLTKQKVSFRPFLVKEQRNLLLARDGESNEEIFEAVSSLLTSVSDLKVDPRKLPMADLEYLFLQVRAKSVGETSTIAVRCPKCNEGTARALINLLEVNIDEEFTDNKVKLDENLMIEFAYPTAETILSAERYTQDGNEMSAIKPLVMSCMVRIFDSEEIYELSDHPDSEIEKFVDSLTMAQFESISLFFGNLPMLKEDVNYSCDNKECGHKFDDVIRGLQNFF